MKTNRVYLLEVYVGAKGRFVIEGYNKNKYCLYDETDRYNTVTILEDVSLKVARDFAKMACEVGYV